ncbi:MAG: hypothetical protein CMF42_01735, partial [Legionellales bacterium]|nr:hypothetical protein [Legionellales bacterium]
MNKDAILNAIHENRVTSEDSDASLTENSRKYLDDLGNLLATFDSGRYGQLQEDIDKKEFTKVLHRIKNMILVYQANKLDFLLTVSLVRKIAQQLLDESAEDSTNCVKTGKQIMQMLDQYSHNEFKGSDSSQETNTIEGIVEDCFAPVAGC